MWIYTDRHGALFRGCAGARRGVISDETREVAMRAVKLAYAAMVLLGLAGCSNELKVTGVEPPQGTYAGGEDVVITGSGLQPGRRGGNGQVRQRHATAGVVAFPGQNHLSAPS